MSPGEVHAAVLAGLARIDALEAAAVTARWSWVDMRRVLVDAHPDGSPLQAPVVLVGVDDEALIIWLRNSAAVVLAGRRRIVERHAPDLDPSSGPWCHDAGHRWPCDDYRDAAADLLPEGAA